MSARVQRADLRAVAQVVDAGGDVVVSGLKAGERVIEYRGERITWKEADRRPPSDPDDPHHTFFFSLSDGKTVIDAASGGEDDIIILSATDTDPRSAKTTTASTAVAGAAAASHRVPFSPPHGGTVGDDH